MSTTRPAFLEDFANTRSLHPLASFARASLGTAANARGEWSEIAANIPRFGFDAVTGECLGLQIEGARTNSIRNPRQEGVVIGTPGTLPTNLTIANTGGLVTNVIATGTTNGVNWVRYQAVGTASGASYVMQFESGTQIVATPSQLWGCSLFFRAVSGSYNSVEHNVASRTSGGALVGAVANPAIAGTATLARYGAVVALDAGGTVARMNSGIRFGLTSTVAYDFQFEIGWYQAEAGGTVSSPILPTVASPAASTRATETYSIPVTSLETGANFACVVIWEGVVTQAAAAGASQTLWQADDGTDNNRYFLRNDAAGLTIALYRTLAAASSSAAVIGTTTVNANTRSAVSIDGLGGARGSEDAGAVVAQSGGPTTGITTLRIGSRPSAGDMFGFCKRLAVIPRAAANDAVIVLLSA